MNVVYFKYDPFDIVRGQDLYTVFLFSTQVWIFYKIIQCVCRVVGTRFGCNRVPPKGNVRRMPMFKIERANVISTKFASEYNLIVGMSFIRIWKNEQSPGNFLAQFWNRRSWHLIGGMLWKMDKSCYYVLPNLKINGANQHLENLKNSKFFTSYVIPSILMQILYLIKKTSSYLEYCYYILYLYLYSNWNFHHRRCSWMYFSHPRHCSETKQNKNIVEFSA